MIHKKLLNLGLSMLLLGYSTHGFSSQLVKNEDCLNDLSNALNGQGANDWVSNLRFSVGNGTERNGENCTIVNESMKFLSARSRDNLYPATVQVSQMRQCGNETDVVEKFFVFVNPNRTTVTTTVIDQMDKSRLESNEVLENEEAPQIMGLVAELLEKDVKSTLSFKMRNAEIYSETDGNSGYSPNQVITMFENLSRNLNKGDSCKKLEDKRVSDAIANLTSEIANRIDKLRGMDGYTENIDPVSSADVDEVRLRQKLKN